VAFLLHCDNNINSMYESLMFVSCAANDGGGDFALTGWCCSDIVPAVSHLYGTRYQAVCPSLGSWHCQQLW